MWWFSSKTLKRRPVSTYGFAKCLAPPLPRPFPKPWPFPKPSSTIPQTTGTDQAEITAAAITSMFPCTKFVAKGMGQVSKRRKKKSIKKSKKNQYFKLPKTTSKSNRFPPKMTSLDIDVAILIFILHVKIN